MIDKFGRVICFLFCGLLLLPITQPLAYVESSFQSIEPIYVLTNTTEESMQEKARSLSDNHFIRNEGQIDSEEILFYSAGENVFFTSHGVFLRFSDKEPIYENGSDHAPVVGNMRQYPIEFHQRGVVLKYSFIGSNTVIPKGRERCPWNTNYFKGSDPEEWHADVPNFKEIIYPGLWDGIDLVYRLKEGSIKYDLIISPGSDPSDIRIQIDGTKGLSINSEGDLVIGTEYWDIHENGLVSHYGDGLVGSIPCRFVLLDNNEYSICLEEYDGSRIAVIDPVIDYSTFIGGSSGDFGEDIVIDDGGNAYIIGTTGSGDGHIGKNDFPTTPGAFDITFNGVWDVFVTNLNPSGSSLVYSTFIGGSNNDLGKGIAIDTDGNAYLTGYTRNGTIGYPTTYGAFDTTFNGASDVFVTKLNPSGSSLVYSTFIGGGENDLCTDIAIDGNGNAYITGITYGSQIEYPTTSGAFDSTYNGGLTDVFVTKLNLAGSALVYSSFIGGSDSECGMGIEVDKSGNAYITGYTRDGTTDYPTTIGAFSTTHNGSKDVFVTSLNAAGSSLEYSTLIGGSGDDNGLDIAIDGKGNAYITGTTGSQIEYPTTSGAFDPTYNGGLFDVFVTKLNHTGSSLEYSTFIGGSDIETANGISIDSHGCAYITGWTKNCTIDYPTTIGAFSSTHNGGIDVFLSRFDPTGSWLNYSTFLGGSQNDHGNGIAIDTMGNLYITGDTEYDTTNYPTTTEAYDTTQNGGVDVFVTKLAFDIDNIPPVFGKDNSDRNATTGDKFKFEVAVSDNTGLSAVFLMYRFGKGSFTNTMMNDFGPFKYNITIPKNSIETLHYKFKALDIWGNSAETSEKTIIIVDNDRPEFGIDQTPATGTSGNSLSFGVKVYDNIDVSSVFVDYRIGSNMNINESMSGSDTFNHSIEIPLNFSGELSYNFSSVDPSGNWNTTITRTVSIVDGTPPKFINDLTPDRIGTGDILTFMVEVSDNIEVISVYVEYWIGSEGHMNESMEETAFFTYSIVVPSNSTDMIWYIFHTTDYFGNSNSIQGSVIVVDTLSPHAEFFIDSRIKEDRLVILDGSESSDNIEIIDWIWKISGGSNEKILHGKNANHIFTEPGNYTVGLKVVDLAGNWNKKLVEISITDITKPIANAGEDRSIPEDLNFTFDSSQSGDNVKIVNWSWLFFDEVDIALQGPSPEYTFKNPGIFNITLTVFDNVGNFGTDNLTLIVRDITPPMADAGKDQTLSMGSTGILNGSASTDNVGIINWTWTFKMGNEVVVMYGNHIEYTFTIPGNFTVTLEVKDRENNTGSDETVINVTMIGKDDDEEDRSSLNDFWWIIFLLLGIISSIFIFIMIGRRNNIKIIK